MMRGAQNSKYWAGSLKSSGITPTISIAWPFISDVMREWTVKDVVAHLCGACEDILAGRLEGVATDPWTEAQVARFEGADLEVVDTSGLVNGP